MEYYFGSVIERDADLAIMNAFERSEAVRNLFLKKIGRTGAVLLKSFHSLVQAEEGYGVGESDILFILQDKAGKFGLFIEDKINADQQPFQRERYSVRANQLVKDDLFQKPYIFLCAPQSYLGSSKAKDYKDMTVSYESLVDCLSDGLDKALLSKASESKSGVVVDKKTTDFWNKLYDYVRENYKDLDLCGEKGDRSNRSLWPTFRTEVKGLAIIMKISHRTVDLEFRGMGDRIEEVVPILNSVGVEEAPEETGSSVSLRCPISLEDAIYTAIDFDEQIDKIDKWLRVVSFLTTKAKAIKALGIQSFGA